MKLKNIKKSKRENKMAKKKKKLMGRNDGLDPFNKKKRITYLKKVKEAVAWREEYGEPWKQDDIRLKDANQELRKLKLPSPKTLINRIRKDGVKIGSVKAIKTDWIMEKYKISRTELNNIQKQNRRNLDVNNNWVTYSRADKSDPSYTITKKKK